MLWKGRSGSDNVEDRRGLSTGGILKGGSALGLVVYLLYAFLGGDPSQLPDINSMQSGKTLSAAEQQSEDTMAQFVSVVLAETEDVWTDLLKEHFKDYAKALRENTDC